MLEGTNKNYEIEICCWQSLIWWSFPSLEEKRDRFSVCWNFGYKFDGSSNLIVLLFFLFLFMRLSERERLIIKSMWEKKEEEGFVCSIKWCFWPLSFAPISLFFFPKHKQRILWFILNKYSVEGFEFLLCYCRLKMQG